MLVLGAKNGPAYLVGGGYKSWISDPADLPGLLAACGQTAVVEVNPSTLAALANPPGVPTQLTPAP